ncbi:MAG: alpha/beta hydrolase [Gloeomargarita sp. SKYG116]|nr:alpha/beta hydrolase [Gloeomargarita sp. SKYG116]MDW8400391.1 alpha/beta hydrolase [Gloeomargarita sp. SKYGB_i_bin116]
MTTTSPVLVIHVSELEVQGIPYHQGVYFTFQHHRLRKGQSFSGHLRDEAVALAEQYQADGRFCILVEEEGMLTLCREDSPADADTSAKPLLTVPPCPAPALTPPYQHLSLPDRTLAELLAQVRQNFARRTVSVAGLTWRYWVGGAGAQAILFLPGTVHWGEMWFAYLHAWQGDFRVLAPTYPAATRVEQLVEGLRQLLRQEQLRRVHLVGHSLGGLIALAFLQQYPVLVDKLVLSHTGVGAPGQERVKQARQAERQLQGMSAAEMANQIYERIARKHLTAIPNQEFWRAYFREVLQGTGKTEFIHLNCRVVADFFQRYRLRSQDLNDPKRPVLLVEADNDTTFTPAEQAALKALFPQAQTLTCHGTGHYSVVVAAEQVMPRLVEFWRA